MNESNALRLAKWLDAMPSSGYALPNQAATELRRLHEEVNEQARLLGMSAERELALLAKIDRLERQLETPLYTSPPASKPWVGLTDEERDAILNREFKQWWSRHDAVCRAIEAKLREKNT